MTYEQIKEQPDRSIVPIIAGRVVKVYPPKEPTPAQLKAGIYPQTIVIQNDEGDNMTMQFTLQSQHLDSGSTGGLFHFQSMPNQRGELDGISVNKYTGKDGVEKVSLKVDKRAHFYEIEESAAGQKSGESILPPEAKFEPSVSSLVGLYVQIAREFELQMGGDSTFLQKLTEGSSPITTVFIQACQNGMHRKPLLITSNAITEHSHQAKQHPVSTLTLAKLAAQVVTEGIKPTDEMVRMAGGDWTSLYDEVMKFKGVPDDVQTAAWEKVSKMLDAINQSTSTTNICKTICIDIRNFEEIIETV